jgi:hypothetical protein
MPCRAMPSRRPRPRCVRSTRCSWYSRPGSKQRLAFPPDRAVRPSWSASAALRAYHLAHCSAATAACVAQDWTRGIRAVGPQLRTATRPSTTRRANAPHPARTRMAVRSRPMLFAGAAAESAVSRAWTRALLTAHGAARALAHLVRMRSGTGTHQSTHHGRRTLVAQAQQSTITGATPCGLHLPRDMTMMRCVLQHGRTSSRRIV